MIPAKHRILAWLVVLIAVLDVVMLIGNLPSFQAWPFAYDETISYISDIAFFALLASAPLQLIGLVGLVFLVFKTRRTRILLLLPAFAFPVLMQLGLVWACSHGPTCL